MKKNFLLVAPLSAIAAPVFAAPLKKIVYSALSLCAVVFSAQLMAQQMDYFTFTSQNRSYSWSSLASPVVSDFMSGSYFSESTSMGDMTFNNGGGFSGSIYLDNLASTQQVYSGDESSPTFLVGTYIGLEYNDSFIASPATLTISAIAPVPEPESYAMILAGLGLMGFMVCRKRSA